MARPQDPQRRMDLLAAAAAVLAVRGIASLTLRPLAAELEVSPRTLLYHFGSKENLLTAAIRHLRHQQPALTSALDSTVLPGKNAADALRTTMSHMWEEAKQPQSRSFLALYFELAALAIRNPDQYGGMLHELDQDWTHTITTHLLHAGINSNTAESLTNSLLMGYRGALHFGLVTGNWNAADHAINTLVDDCCHRLG